MVAGALAALAASLALLVSAVLFPHAAWLLWLSLAADALAAALVVRALAGRRPPGGRPR